MNKLLLACVLLALIFFTAGVSIYSNPKQINSFYGYRSRTSRRNQDTWDEANTYAGKCLMYSAILMIGVVILSDYIFNDVFKLIESLLVCIILSVVGIIFFTERRMKEVFYRDGKRKPNR